MKTDDKKLRELFRGLSAADQRTLIRFAEFLVQQAATEADGTVMAVFPDPIAIPRPPDESVVKGIKRLTETYPMIDRDKLLHQTSDLMAAHVINGRSASEVIDELEQVFAEHYQQMKAEFEQNR